MLRSSVSLMTYLERFLVVVLCSRTLKELCLAQACSFLNLIDTDFFHFALENHLNLRVNPWVVVYVCEQVVQLLSSLCLFLLRVASWNWYLLLLLLNHRFLRRHIRIAFSLLHA